VADPDSLTAGWYFLCVNDSNGCQVCDSAYVDEPNGIAGSAPALVLAAHPNPFSDETTVHLPQAFATGTLHVVLTDLRGRKVRETTAHPAAVLHIGRDGLPPGLYLLAVTDPGGRTARGRLMVR